MDQQDKFFSEAGTQTTKQGSALPTHLALGALICAAGALVLSFYNHSRLTKLDALTDSFERLNSALDRNSQAREIKASALERTERMAMEPAELIQHLKNELTSKQDGAWTINWTFGPREPKEIHWQGETIQDKGDPNLVFFIQRKRDDTGEKLGMTHLNDAKKFFTETFKNCLGDSELRAGPEIIQAAFWKKLNTQRGQKEGGNDKGFGSTYEIEAEIYADYLGIWIRHP